MKRLGWLGLITSFALCGVACSGSDSDSGGEAGSSAAGNSAAGSNSNVGGAGAATSTGGLGGAGGGTGGNQPTAGDSAGGSAQGGSAGDTATASIAGQIGRTARIPNGLDGVGDVYIAVFSDNPVTNMNAQALANTLIENADLSVDGTGISYRVDNIPVSSEPRYVVAFMDDDGNVTPEDPSPKKPDLIAFDGLSPITVTLASPGVTELDLVLNAEIPF